jgi:Domain of unknown function (DUF4340)
MSRRLVIVWVLLLGLVAAIVLLGRERQVIVAGKGEEHSGVPSGDRRLLPAPMAQLGVIEIAYGGALHRFERDAQGAWFYHAHATNAAAVANHTHRADAAVARRIEKAFAGFENARREREFPNDPSADFGVAAPQMFVVVYGRDTSAPPLMRYAIGNLAPDNFSRYVLPTGSASVVTIANYQFDNLANLIKDMQSKAPG